MTARSAPGAPGARPLLVPDAGALRAFWDHVVRPGDVHEVRIPQSRAGPLRLFGTVSGYFDDPDAFVSALRRVTGTDASAVYITLNPVKTALLARARNRLENRARSTASDGDVLRRRLLLIDLDPVRDPKDISATDRELAAALARRDLVAFGLGDGFGWPDPLLCATSGNGGALLYLVDLPNDDASTALVQRVLAALDANWSDAAVKLDVVNYNAARITKVIGTVAAKGEDLVGHPRLDDRPWRLASASYPAGAAVVSVEQLAALAADGPQPQAAPTNGARPISVSARTWTMEDLLSANGLHASARSWQGGGTKYPLDHCLTSPDHCDGACLIEMPSGAIVYRCHHDRCSGKGWSYIKEQGILRIPGQEQRERGKTPHAGQSGPDHQARSAQQPQPQTTSSGPKANGNGHGPQADASDAVASRGVWVRLSTVVAEQVEWVWPARIPKGKLTLIGGDPGVGKSFLLFAILTHVTRGWAWPDGEPCPGPADCILLCGEDGLADTVRPRVDALGGDPTRVWPFKGMTMDDGTVRGPSLASALDVAEIERKIAQTDARLVLVDPINTYLDPKMDTFKGPPVRAITTPLAGLAERTGVAVVLVCHLTKATLQQALYRMPGSVDFVAAARSVLAVGYDPQSEDGRRLLLPVKNNLSAHAAGLGFNIVDGALRWDKDAVDVNAAAMLGGSAANGNGHGQAGAEGVGAPRATKADAAADLLRMLLRAGPLRANDVFAAAIKAGISKRTVNEAKASLGVTSAKARGQDATWWWSLPDAPGGAAPDAAQDNLHPCTLASLETDSDVSLNRNGHAELVHGSAASPEDQQECKDARMQHGDGEPAVDDGEDWPF